MRIALGIEYDGAAYSGWQIQSQRPSIQAVLQDSLSLLADSPVAVTCAGRTDAGVHATGQVIHFDTAVHRSCHAWTMGGNTRLPHDVRILWAQPVESCFHARSSALARLYRYVVINRPMHSALTHGRATWDYRPLDVAAMQMAASCLPGEQDFSAFRAQHCQSSSPFRNLYFMDIERQQDWVTFHVCANAFVHHMVRNMVGSLLEVGAGRRDPEWLRQVLQGRKRKLAGPTAPPDGLYFEGVLYPDDFGLPRHPRFALLPPGIRRYSAENRQAFSS